jgi:hypothetical protein
MRRRYGLSPSQIYPSYSYAQPALNSAKADLGSRKKTLSERVVDLSNDESDALSSQYIVGGVDTCAYAP